MPRSLAQLRADALTIFHAGLEAADAGKAVARHLAVDAAERVLCVGTDVRLPLAMFDRIFVVGAGKAAAPMAFAVEQIVAPYIPPQGLVNVKYGHTSPRPHGIALNECGHPLPDDAGVKGAHEIERILDQLTERDLLIVVVSGGASALLPAPAGGVTLEEKQQTTELLLRAGADICELNAVRKHLSSLKGGHLAVRAHPAAVVSLLLSDVIGDPPCVIGSGLTESDPSTYQEAAHVLRKFDLWQAVPAAVAQRLERGIRGEVAETPKPGNRACEAVHSLVVGSNRLAIESAQYAARALGYQTLILSSTVQGESREVARVHAEMLRRVVSSGGPVALPACILSGGETTVTVRGAGKGGRNQEFALAAAISVAGLSKAVVLSAGTDGTDGPTDAAGAIIDGTTMERALAMGLSPLESLHRNDSYPLLQALGDLVMTGPTGTNVMDLQIMLAAEG